MAEFQHSAQENLSFLEIRGRIEPDDWKSLKEALESATAGRESGALVIEVSKLEYIASSGFRELFLIGRNLERAGGKLAVAGLQGAVKRVFELSGFSSTFPVFETKEEAGASLGAK